MHRKPRIVRDSFFFFLYLEQSGNSREIFIGTAQGFFFLILSLMILLLWDVSLEMYGNAWTRDVFLKNCLIIL